MLLYVCGRRKRGRAIPPALCFVLGLVFLFGLFFCLFGTTATVLSIAAKWQVEPPQEALDSYQPPASANRYNLSDYSLLAADAAPGTSNYAAVHTAAHAAVAAVAAHAHMYSPRLLHTQSWHQGNTSARALLWALDASSGRAGATAAVERTAAEARQRAGTRMPDSPPQRRSAAAVGGGVGGVRSTLLPTAFMGT